jgi:hypothetical protein
METLMPAGAGAPSSLHAEVVFDAAKRTEPLGIDPLRYRVTLTSDEPAARLEELYRIATTDGAATNAILNGVTPESELVVLSRVGLKP